MAWRWTAYRLGISAFLVFHLGATVFWVMPPSPIKPIGMMWVRRYMLPMGLWQYWGMFAPDPQRDTIFLKAEVVDAQGLRHAYSFPHTADFSKWRGVPRFRHAKFASNLLAEELIIAQKFTARHVVRQLKLPADAYPLSVQLYFLFRAPPPSGELPDPMIPLQTKVIDTFHFSSPNEVVP